MKPIDSIWSWFTKTILFLAGTAMVYTGAVYFAGGGKLIIDKSIPIAGLVSCLILPMGIMVSIGMIYVIAHTEKELDE